MSRVRIVLGVGGVPPHDNARAYHWEHRLRWIMAGVALLSVPGFYLDVLVTEPSLHHYGRAIEALIVLAFSAEIAWMLSVVDQRARYLRYNWLDPVIVVCAAMSLFGIDAALVALGRLLRLTLVGLLLLRAAATMRGLFLPGRIPYVLVLGFGLLLLSGAGFYWLEPTIHTFGDGLWLAFVTGATVGYGDMIPTTLASRIFAVISVFVGFTLLSVMTAYVASIFVGEDEKRLRLEMHQDIRNLREDVAQMVNEEERAIRREMQRDIRELKEEIAALRAEVRRALHQERRDR